VEVCTLQGINDDLILNVKNLKVYFQLTEGLLKAVDGVDFVVKQGKTLGLLGESGCGKTVTGQALLRIVPKPGSVSGEIILRNRADGTLTDLVQLDPFGQEIRKVRGAEISMIFQNPQSPLTPHAAVGAQTVARPVDRLNVAVVEVGDVGRIAPRRVGVPDPRFQLGVG